MSTATITVQEILPPKPGGKMHVVVDTNGDKYYVFSDKVHHYDIGGVYDVTYKLSQFKTRNVDSAVRSRAAPSAPQQRAPTQHTGGNAGGGAHDEHIHVSLILKEAIRANLLDPNNEDAVVELAMKARSAHKRIWSPAPQRQAPPQSDAGPAPRRSDMDDDIPFAPEWR